MEQILLNGSGITGTISGHDDLGIHIKSLEIDVPLDEVGSTDPYVTLSGSSTGAYTFHSDTTLDLKYAVGEDVGITTTNFTSEYSTVIRYVYYGDTRKTLMTTNANQKQPIPWRFRTDAYLSPSGLHSSTY